MSVPSAALMLLLASGSALAINLGLGEVKHPNGLTIWNVNCSLEELYPGPECNQFFMCVDGLANVRRLVRFSCGAGTAFSPRSSVCVHSPSCAPGVPATPPPSGPTTSSGPEVQGTPGPVQPNISVLPGPIPPPGVFPPIFPPQPNFTVLPPAPPAAVVPDSTTDEPASELPVGPSVSSVVSVVGGAAEEVLPPAAPPLEDLKQFSPLSRPLINLDPSAILFFGSDDSFDCPQYQLDETSFVNCTREGRWEHTGSCQKFFQCIHTMDCIVKGFQFRCPAGYVFGAQESRCVPQQSPCEKLEPVPSEGSFVFPVIQLDEDGLQDFEVATVYWDYMPFIAQETYE
ncbi:sulfated surface glycoprotein 185-like [Hyalella azteca]|uniref:Sulfated surface glycoprotein 185-like n=1 Tax=Hyalella azteca TaxID=294128 RepID=A0A979FJ50_HYAAZ|nr:sulfated surface glycoprotein 185-like [Hyalella azteca]